ncbi:SGNH/GDSL hydrolase family protein [Micromonospora chersina]|uniref:hypothetical protein n=1 Tax=Micromonospora chersina TaxID=47854 RepID=UPI0036AD6F82
MTSWHGSPPSALPATPNLYHLDGLDLYGEADLAELPLPDQLHPDTATHRRIAERFAKRVLSGVGDARSA